ncbi:hypothetical protein [Celerinatantimonas yamalensis]|uniref:Antitoxin VbhA domain-containing protein n=1 Tax=Celerinatantimonas yamalensis TaxID=559956 RepID=A0ABW9GA70_9GAMM
MHLNHATAALSFAESGYIDRYLKAREQFFKSACQFVVKERESEQDLSRSALSHAYQQGWISITEFQRWNSQLADSGC